MNLLEKMKNKDQFTESEQYIVNYLLEHRKEKLTITELAMNTYTSNSTIIRLCRKLGFDGYRSFYMKFIKESESNKYISEEVDYSFPFHEMENIYDIVNHMTNLYRKSIDLLTKEIDGKIIEAIGRKLLRAERIFIYSIGDSLITARAFANKLHKIGIYPIMANKNFENITATHNATAKDCAIFLSYRMNFSEFMRDYKQLNKKHVSIIAITSNEKNYITKHAFYKIIIPRKEENFTIATFYSQIAFNYVCNLLYAAIYAMNYTKNRQYKKEVDDIQGKGKEKNTKY